MEARLASETPAGLGRSVCYWCLDWFGKLAWLKDYPQSAWGVGRQATSGAR